MITASGECDSDFCCGYALADSLIADAGGNIPVWMAESALTSTVCKDVPLCVIFNLDFFLDSKKFAVLSFLDSLNGLLSRRKSS